MKRIELTRLAFFLLALIFSGACTQGCNAGNPTPASNGIPVDTSYQFPYFLGAPDSVYSLPSSLKEISGLSLLPGETKLVAVEDEHGLVYILDRFDGKLFMEVEFNDDGDYEGLEAVGNEVWVLKSNGHLYRILGFASEGQQVIRYNTFLEKKDNTEGLGYDPVSNSLLIACKGKKNDDLEKNVYRFRLDSFRLDSIPALHFNLDNIGAYLEKTEYVRKVEEIMDFLQPEEGGLTFAPSGIAMDPLSGHFFILSSVGKLLIVADRNNNILHIEKLSKKIHPQPESICFASDGTLWIGNEGKGGTATILRFARQKQNTPGN